MNDSHGSYRENGIKEKISRYGMDGDDGHGDGDEKMKEEDMEEMDSWRGIGMREHPRIHDRSRIMQSELTVNNFSVFGGPARKRRNCSILLRCMIKSDNEFHGLDKSCNELK